VIDSLEAREEEGMASSMKRWLADAGKSE
jgi:hypothetical protein